jgi:hypothetical protein
MMQKRKLGHSGLEVSALGQQPTVSILRGLVAKQTWPSAEISQGDTWWFSELNAG